jgi:hypothetical protein
MDSALDGIEVGVAKAIGHGVSLVGAKSEVRDLSAILPILIKGQTDLPLDCYELTAERLDLASILFESIEHAGEEHFVFLMLGL